MHVDAEQRVWVGTLDGGLCCREGGRFLGPRDLSGPDRGVTCLYEDDDGRLWVGGRGVLGYHDGTAYHDLFEDCCRAVHHVAEVSCWGIVCDAEGVVWFGFLSAIAYDGRAFREVGFPAGPRPLDAGNHCVGLSPDGRALVGGHGVAACDGGPFAPGEALAGTPIRAIQRDRSGTTWFCTGGQGALSWDGESLRQYARRERLQADYVQSVLLDSEGQLWFATWGAGLIVHDPQSFQVHELSEEEPSRGDTRRLLRDRRGRLWVGRHAAPVDGRGGGAGLFDGRYHAIVEAGDSEGIGACLSLCEGGDGEVWLGGSRGLAVYDGASMRRVDHESLRDAFVSAMAPGRGGRLYVGCWCPTADDLRLYARDGSSFEPLFVRPGEEMYTSITSILESHEGDVWVGLGAWLGQGPGRGVARIRPDGRVSIHTAADGLVDDRVEDLHESPAGTIWIATLGGVCLWRDDRFEPFAAADRLPHGHVRCIHRDGDGHLWFGTEAGVARYDGQTLQIVRYDGMDPTHDILEDGEGRLWFATEGGVVHYTPGSKAPRARVVRILADREYNGEDAARVVASTPHVSFEYRGMSLRTYPSEMVYCYRLLGHDTDWQPSTRERRAEYQGLAQGTYEFQVRAVDRDLQYSAPACATVEIVPDPLVAAMAEALAEMGSTEGFVGTSPALRQVQEQLAGAAPSDLTVLLLGETGTGKGLAARTLHAMSDRSGGPFIQINCGAIPAGLVESELFGHERGAFTGATSRKLGRAELAEGGTLFMDEVGDLPPEAQVKVLRVLEERTFERVGGTETLRADVRVVASTNRDLGAMVAEGTFREDLYYRLHVLPIQLPPLRERREDIAVLAGYFAQRMAEHLGKPTPSIQRAALEALRRRDWPGNVRELEHTVQRAVVICQDAEIGPEHLGVGATGPGSQAGDELTPPEEYERQYIERLLERTGGIIAGPDGAAAIWGIPESTFRSRMRRLGLRRR